MKPIRAEVVAIEAFDGFQSQDCRKATLKLWGAGGTSMQVEGNANDMRAFAVRRWATVTIIFDPNPKARKKK